MTNTVARNRLNQAARILNVRTESTAKEIDRAYRKLALKHHPDKNVGKDDFEKSVERFARIKIARDVLLSGGGDCNGSTEFKEFDVFDGTGEDARKPLYDWKRTRKIDDDEEAKGKVVKEDECDNINKNASNGDADDADDEKKKQTPEEDLKPHSKVLHKAHGDNMITTMSVLRMDDTIKFVATGDSNGFLVVYEKSSERVIFTQRNRDNLGAVASLVWNEVDENDNDVDGDDQEVDKVAEKKCIFLCATFALGTDAFVYEFRYDFPPASRPFLTLIGKATLSGSHSKRITCCAFYHDVLAIGAADGTCSVWTRIEENNDLGQIKTKMNTRDSSNEWARKRLLRHSMNQFNDSDDDNKRIPAITSTLLIEVKRVFYFITSDSNGRFKVWKGNKLSLEKITCMHDVNWSGCGGISKTAIVQISSKSADSSSSSPKEKLLLATSHFDPVANISRVLCWNAFEETTIRGYVYEYPRKHVPFRGRLSSFDFIARNEKEENTEGGEESDDDDDSFSSSSLGAFVANKALTIIDISANTSLFTLDLPSDAKQTKFSPNGEYVACALTSGTIDVYSVDDAELAFRVPNAAAAAAAADEEEEEVEERTITSNNDNNTIWSLQWVAINAFVYGKNASSLCEVVLPPHRFA